MGKIIDVMKSADDFYAATGVSETEIKKAEEKLALSFAEEYKDYLRTFGVAEARGHEYTGICNSSRLNVVDVTLEEKKKDPLIPADCYVIEQTGVDRIVIWQSSTGTIYQSVPDVEMIEIYDSFSDYVSYAK